jgi:hypothetical protein
LNKKLLVVAALLSAVGSAAYACTFMPAGTSSNYSICLQVSYVGMPGILFAAALSIALLGGHGGGPLGMELVIATPVNFFLYLAIGAAIRKVALLFIKPGR